MRPDFDDHDSLADELAAVRRRLQERPDDFALNMQAGHLLCELGHYESALEHFRCAATVDAADPAAWYALGFAASGAMKLDAAEVALKRALELRPDDAAAHALLASVYSHLDRHAAAIEAGRRALEGELERKWRGWLHSAMGRSYGELGDLEGALFHLIEAVDADPENAAAQHNLGVAYVLRGNYRAAVPHLERAVRLLPDHSGAWYDLGRAARQAEMLQTAREALERAISLGRDDGDARMELARALLGLGQPEAALPRLARAASLDPDSADVWFTYGCAASDTGALEIARHAFEQSVALAPDDLEARLKLAWVLQSLGDYPAAIEQAGAGLAAAPDAAWRSWFHQSLAASWSESGRIDTALEHLYEAIRANPEDAVAHYNLGVEFVKQEDFEQARISLERASSLDPENTLYRLILAQAYTAEEQYERVEPVLRGLLGTDQHEAAHMLLVECALERRQPEEALRLARAEVAANATSGVAWAALGRALRAADDAAGAVGAFTRAQALAPENEWVTWALEEDAGNTEVEPGGTLAVAPEVNTDDHASP